MKDHLIIDRPFYARRSLIVARELIGAMLIRKEGDTRIGGIIVETEAYCGEDDLGCHCRAGRTERNQAMYGQPGHAYIYFTYGMHWMLNVVVEVEGFPAAILIRAIKPIEGLSIIAQRRQGQPEKQWTNGPAKVCQALNIDHRFYGIDLCNPESGLFIEQGIEFSDSQIEISARVGLNSVPEPWKSKPWRFRIK
jgi:DNA-3-methyladenine glycosylase